jgi:hypothetical protein
MNRLEIIEVKTKQELIESFEAFAQEHDVALSGVKFQRNLFYAGIGSSAGRTPGSEKALDADTKLEELWVAFIPWTQYVSYDDTRYID